MMAVAVYIKSESGDDYLNVWEGNPANQSIIDWIEYYVDSPSGWEISLTGNIESRWEEIEDIVREACENWE